MDGLPRRDEADRREAAQEPQDAAIQMSGDEYATAGGAILPKATTASKCKDCETALTKHNARLAELEDEIAKEAKTAEGEEALCREIDELRSKAQSPNA